MMKKVVSVLVAFTMLFCLFPVGISAAFSLTPASLGSSAEKKVLKPGLIDYFSAGSDHEVVSDYAQPNDPSVQAQPLSWAVDPNLTYWGYAPNQVYTAGNWAGASATKSLTYKVLPDSYVCIPVMIRTEYAAAGITPADFTLEVSENGTAWSAVTPTTFQVSLASNNVVHYLTVKMASNQTRIRITFPPQSKMLLTGKGQDWLNQGAIHIGMAKASWTNITAASGTGSGDPVKNWYDDATISTKADSPITLSGSSLIVTKVQTEDVRLRDVVTGMNAVNCSLSFYNGSTRITDLDTAVSSGLTVKAVAYTGCYFPANQSNVSYTMALEDKLPTPTLNQNQTKRVLKPGVVDVFSYQNGTYLSDYSVAVGNVQGTSACWTWSSQNGTDVTFWGYHPSSVYTLRFWGDGPNGVQYKVLPGSYVSFPFSMRNEYSAALGSNALTIQVSADRTTWTTVSATVTSRTFGSFNCQQLYTVKIPAGRQYVRALFPQYDSLYAITPYDGWFESGSVFIGPAKASWSNIAAFEGSGSGDTVVKEYEDAAFSVKTGAMVSLSGTVATVDKMSNENVTLQNVADSFAVTNCSICFFDGNTEITDLTTPVSNGLLVKAVADRDAFFSNYGTAVSFTMQVSKNPVTRRPQPTIAATADKLVLEPGQTDAYSSGISDYATLIGGQMSGKTVQAGQWYSNYDNAQYWGYQPYDVYTLAENAQDIPGQFNGVSYKAIENTYIAIPFQIHHDHWTNLVQNELVFETAKNGTWATAEPESCFDVYDSNIHTFYIIIKIPSGHDQLRIKFPSVAKLSSTHNQDWVSNGTFSMGMPKASLTPITGATGASAGDAVTVWNGFDGTSPSHVANFYTYSPTSRQQEVPSCPEFSWSAATGADSYTLVLEKYEDYGAFAVVFEAEGITQTSYTCPNPLEANSIYRWKVYSVKQGCRRLCQGMPGEGSVFQTKTDPRNHPANYEIDYTFQNTVSEPVLKNYLARSMTQGVFDDLSTAQEKLRMIYYTGAKYVGRSLSAWQMTGDEAALYPQYQALITQAHEVDPEIVFEACIFETTFRSIEQIAIPSWVFEAFDQPVVTRNFDYESMLFADGSYVNQWGTDASVPDMTRLETQMWFYYRACCYIDAGFEGLHMGQVELTGKNDTGYACWQSVLNKIRTYASSHARRGFVFINAHTHGVKGPDGKLLFDFHAYPMRGKSPSGSTAHAPSEDDPQQIDLQVDYLDSIYQKSMGGTTYSGWSCDSLPYIVEQDNWCGYDANLLDQTTTSDSICWWGMDEISWYANQPKWYRWQWLTYAYNWVRSTDSAGYMEPAGTKTAALRSGDSISQLTYHADSKLFLAEGSDDELNIRNIWIAERNAR